MDIRGFEVVSAFEEQNINLPTRKTTESAGYDIECAEAVTLEPNQVVLVPTGLKAFMAYDEYLAIHIRSSMAIKRHLALVNSTGIIDSDYYNNEDNEGHIMIALLNFGNEPVTLEKGERVAQGIFSKYLITNDDDATGVRTGGIGSTGTMQATYNSEQNGESRSTQVGRLFVCKKLRIGFDILKLIHKIIGLQYRGVLYENRCYQRST